MYSYRNNMAFYKILSQQLLQGQVPRIELQDI